MQLKSAGKEGTKKGRPATTWQDILVLALIVLAALDLVVVLAFAAFWALNG